MTKSRQGSGYQLLSPEFQNGNSNQDHSESRAAKLVNTPLKRIFVAGVAVTLTTLLTAGAMAAYDEKEGTHHFADTSNLLWSLLASSNVTSWLNFLGKDSNIGLVLLERGSEAFVWGASIWSAGEAVKKGGSKMVECIKDRDSSTDFDSAFTV